MVDEQGIAYACKLRGRFMQDRRGQGWERLLPGDRVRILPLANNEGVIEEILPRDVTLKAAPSCQCHSSFGRRRLDAADAEPGSFGPIACFV